MFKLQFNFFFNMQWSEPVDIQLEYNLCSRSDTSDSKFYSCCGTMLGDDLILSLSLGY